MGPEREDVLPPELCASEPASLEDVMRGVRALAQFMGWKAECFVLTADGLEVRLLPA